MEITLLLGSFSAVRRLEVDDVTYLISGAQSNVGLPKPTLPLNYTDSSPGVNIHSLGRLKLKIVSVADHVCSIGRTWADRVLP